MRIESHYISLILNYFRIKIDDTPASTTTTPADIIQSDDNNDEDDVIMFSPVQSHADLQLDTAQVTLFQNL